MQAVLSNLSSDLVYKEMISVELNKLFERLYGSVRGKLLELLVVFRLVELKVVADGTKNYKRHLVHVAHMTDRAALHLAAKRVKLKGDEFALGTVSNKDIARCYPAYFNMSAEVLTALSELIACLLCLCVIKKQ